MKRKKRKSSKLQSINLFFELQDNSKQLSFAEVCTFIRDTFNATQAEMAEKFKVTLRTYQYWEYGETSPNAEAAFNLCLLYLHAKKQFAEEQNNLKQPEELFSTLNNNSNNAASTSI